jgi:hypothetical protein
MALDNTRKAHDRHNSILYLEYNHVTFRKLYVQNRLLVLHCAFPSIYDLDYNI